MVDETGEITKVKSDSAQIALYKKMRSTLVYLTHLDYEDTRQIMTTKLSKQMDNSEYNRDNLCSLCWAIGSISGTFQESMEKQFLIQVTRDLLNLTEMKRGKDNKAMIAGNIMYIVGQYPRFLRAHWKFLKTVVLKLFEFMHEKFEGVQDMACETFLRIAQRCRRKFTTSQVDQPRPFVEEVIENLVPITTDLNPSQTEMFFEAVGYMVGAQASTPAKLESNLFGLMLQPNNRWAELLSDPNILQDQPVAKQLSYLLRLNERVAYALGTPYLLQLSRNYNDILSVYKMYSEAVSMAVVQGQAYVLVTAQVRAMRSVKKSILRLVETVVMKSSDEEQLVNEFVPPLLEALLLDYKNLAPPARDPEALSLVATIIDKFKAMMTPQVPRIFDAVFNPTIEMLDGSFDEFPEMRKNFFTLMKAINSHCFEALLSMGEQFDHFIKAIFVAVQDKTREVSETGLQTLFDLLNNVTADPNIQNTLHGMYYTHFLREVFFVLTDGFHQSGFSLQCTILMMMISQVENGQIQASLFPDNSNNPIALRSFLRDMFLAQFTNLVPAQAEQIVIALFASCQDFRTFKSNIRDFLVQTKQFGGAGVDELFAEEAAAQRQQDREVDMTIPGMIAPAELDDEF